MENSMGDKPKARCRKSGKNVDVTSGEGCPNPDSHASTEVNVLFMPICRKRKKQKKQINHTGEIVEFFMLDTLLMHNKIADSL
jgi:hypothetical protein